MTKIQLIKLAVNIVVGAGTAKIVASTIENNTNPEKVTDQVATQAAAGVLGWMACDATRAYTDAKIDEIAAWYNDRVKKTA